MVRNKKTKGVAEAAAGGAATGPEWVLPEALASALQNNLMVQREELAKSRDVQRFLQCTQLLRALGGLAATREAAERHEKARRKTGATKSPAAGDDADGGTAFDYDGPDST